MKYESLPTVAHDIKGYPTEDENPTMLISTPTRRFRPLALAFLAVASLYLLWASIRYPTFTLGCSGLKNVSAKNELVPLEAHIMSKCPDARDCLKLMVLPAMQRVYDKVNFTLSYIGTPTDNDGVDCMHGPEECLGNIIELCAANQYPDPKIYLGFTMCLTRDYQDIPQKSLIEDCALEHGMNFTKLNECAARDDGFGIGMLRDSVKRSTQVC
ncbi:hypothetical protein B7494_g44 [Chlorociboria aeruginascens]|nr:hypothetical protein B7494_g44 [Chlorociboria aeruginascens]